MSVIEVIVCLLAAILGALFACSYFLKRILNILRQMNNGEPSREELRNIDFSKIRYK